MQMKNTPRTNTDTICMTVVLFMVCFLRKNADSECLRCYHPAITIWMETYKQRKYTNISSAVQKVLISDKIKTQCDQWASIQACGRWAAFLHWLFELSLPQAFSAALRLLLFWWGHQQWLGCVVGLSVVPRSSDSCYAIWTGLDGTPHIANTLWEKTGDTQPKRPKRSAAKQQFNTCRNHNLYHSCK